MLYLFVTSAILLVFSICRRTWIPSCSISQYCTFRGLSGSCFALTPLACVLEQNICNTTSFLCAVLLQVAHTYRGLSLCVLLWSNSQILKLLAAIMLYVTLLSKIPQNPRHGWHNSTDTFMSYFIAFLLTKLPASESTSKQGVWYSDVKTSNAVFSKSSEWQIEQNNRQATNCLSFTRSRLRNIKDLARLY